MHTMSGMSFFPHLTHQKQSSLVVSNQCHAPPPLSAISIQGVSFHIGR